MRSVLLALVILSTVARVARSAHILAMVPLPSKSHSIFHYSLAHLLAQKGHTITIYSPYKPLKPHENITHVEITNSLLHLTESWTYDEFKKMFEDSYFGMAALDLLDLCRGISEETLESEVVNKLLHSKEEFDLVIVEAALGQEALLVFGHKFKAPVINLQGFGTWAVVNWVTGNSLSIPYLPSSVNFPFSDRMSFTERFRNFISTVGTLLYYELYHLPKSQAVADRFMPEAPPVTEMLRNIPLTLTNDVATLEYPRTFTPNIVPVAGCHMSSHMTPLSQDVKKFMDSAKEGAIYFSLGTLVPAHLIPQEYIQAFVKTFKKLNKRVLWKINLDSIPGLSDNVMLTKWVSQPTVLAHPNCQLFITHGGLFSQHEVLYAGKPVIAIPFLADQRYNVGFYKHLGVGVELEFLSITEESVTKAISTVLANPSYKEAAERASRIFSDQPMTAADKVVFWVEYVLRNDGARHLIPASASLPWYQLFLLDIIATILVLFLTIAIVFYKIIKLLLRLYFPGRTNVIFSQKKSN